MLAPTLNILVTFASMYLSMIAISVSMDKHYKQIMNRPLNPKWQKVAYWAGWIFMIFSLIFCMRSWGVSIGITAWFGVLTMAACALIITLTYKPVPTVKFSVIISGLIFIVGGMLNILGFIG